MIKTIVTAAIAAITGLFAYLFVNQSCRDGVILRSTAECVRQAGFDAAICADVFARAVDAAMRAGIVFPQEAECRQTHDVCVLRTSPPQGWSPRPTGACVARDNAGRIARVDPVFDRAGGRVMN
ncbi:MAG: hypothetical protein ACRCYS_05655 [Beijerinckiaceae bacterium]